MVTLWRHRELLWQLIRRDVLQRYQGSLLGITWSLLTPLAMLVVYTFVFGVIFPSRWPMTVGNTAEFAVILFTGLASFNIFAETINRAPLSVLGNPSYIKKIVFPVELLPLVGLGTALVNSGISFVIIIIANILVTGDMHLSVLLVPVALIPLILITAGLSWVLASVGVYIRDIVQIVPVFVSALLFVSPIFYPVSAVPENVRWALLLNPLAQVIENVRTVAVWGHSPDWHSLMAATLLSVCIASLGYIWFMKTKKGFADVL